MVSPREEKGKKRRRGAGEDTPALDTLDAAEDGRVPGLKIRLTRKGDAFSISKLEKESADDDGSEEAANDILGERDRGLVSNNVASPVMQIDLVKGTRARDSEGEKRAVESPSKKTKLSGKNGIPEGDVELHGGQEDPLNANKSKMGISADRGFQEKYVAGGEKTNEALVPSTDAAKTTRDGALSTVPDGSSVPPKAPEKASKPEPLNREIYRVPSHAGWFLWGKIHPLERRAVSEFFDQRSLSKTPKIYKEYRDFIINKYRDNPRRLLTFTEVRRMLIGDVNALRRVFDFLEHWGLINHQVSTESSSGPPAAVTPSPSPTLIESLPSGIRVVTPLITTAAKAPSFPLLDTSGKSLAAHASNLATHKTIFTTPSKTSGGDSPAVTPLGPKTPQDEIQCCSCTKDCSKQRFCHRQHSGISLCPDCFKNGKIPAGATASDFVQVDGEAKAPGKEWTSKETLLLLEAVMRFGDNWSQVAAQVPTRSKSECVKQFIQLPFGDNYYVEPEEPNLTLFADGVGREKSAAMVCGEEDVSISSDSKQGGSLVSRDQPASGHATEAAAGHGLMTPFADTSHPLFAQVALLSAMVGPRVAAAAAQAAVAAIAEEEPSVSQLPIMQTPNVQSTLQNNTSHSLQEHPDSLMEANHDLQPEGDGPPQAEDSGLQDPPLLPNSHVQSIVSVAVDDQPSAVQARAIVATTLGVAAANAKLLADQEEREIEHLVANIIDNQLMKATERWHSQKSKVVPLSDINKEMKKLYTKLEHFEELESLLEKERLEVERARLQVFADRLRYAEGQFATPKIVLRKPAPPS